LTRFVGLAHRDGQQQRENSEEVIDKTAAATRTLGWPEQIVDATCAQLQSITNANPNDGSDDGCLGGADQITKPDDRPVRDAVEAKVVARVSLAGSWPNADALPMAAMDPMQFWIAIGRTMAESWADAMGFWR